MKRKEAKQLGVAKYCTNKLCKHGHLSERYTSSGMCVKCEQAWRQENKKRRRGYSNKITTSQYNKQYYQDHRNHILKRCNQWNENHEHYFEEYRKNNKEHICQLNTQYQQENKESICQQRKQHYKNNKQQNNKASKLWRESNPDKVVLNVSRRCNYLKEHTPLWYESDLIKQLYLKRDELNEKWNLNLEVDHIIPITSDTVCGLHCWANLQLLDVYVNQSKYNSYEENW